MNILTQSLERNPLKIRSEALQGLFGPEMKTPLCNLYQKLVFVFELEQQCHLVLFLNLQSKEMFFYWQRKQNSPDLQLSICNQYIKTLLEKDFLQKVGRRVRFEWALKCGYLQAPSQTHDSCLVSVYTLICLFKDNYHPLVNDDVIHKTHEQLKKLLRYYGKHK